MLLKHTALAGVLWGALLPAALHAQQTNPYANDPGVAEAGRYQFRINCALCHGLGARGGARGPDLTRAQKRHGNSDAEIFRTIHDGVPGTDMPAAMGSIGVEMKDQEIWQVITYIRSVQVKTPEPTGNPQHGKEVFFERGCGRCHMMEGKGGRLGPDLTAVAGSRSRVSLVESIREPSKSIVSGYQTVSVVTEPGQDAKGILLNEDLFSLQMMDTREKILLLEKEKLRSLEKSDKSLMPAYDKSALSDKDLDDLIGYLVAVSSK
jgi:putative heme-binding domain-containing protein